MNTTGGLFKLPARGNYCIQSISLSKRESKMDLLRRLPAQILARNEQLKDGSAQTTAIDTPPKEDRGDEIFDYLDKIFLKEEPKLLSNGKPSEPKYKNISEVVTRTPVQFPMALRNAGIDFRNIEKYGREVCDVAKGNEEKLKSAEDTVKDKFDDHLNRQSLSSSKVLPFLISFFVTAVILVFGLRSTSSGGNSKNHTNNISLVLLASTVPQVAGYMSKYILEIVEPFAEDEYLQSTKCYRFCLRILQRAQSEAKARNEDNSSESS